MGLKTNVGSSALRDASVLEILDYVVKCVPAISVGVITQRADGSGTDTTFLMSGNKATTLGLAMMTYNRACRAARQIMELGDEHAVEEQDAIDESSEVEDNTMEDLLTYCMGRAWCLAVGVCIPDDNNECTTFTYMTGNASTCKGLADSAKDVALARAVEDHDDVEDDAQEWKPEG